MTDSSTNLLRFIGALGYHHAPTPPRTTPVRDVTSREQSFGRSFDEAKGAVGGNRRPEEMPGTTQQRFLTPFPCLLALTDKGNNQ
jgi:hypothetical protein